MMNLNKINYYDLGSHITIIKDISRQSNSPVVLCLCRNEELILPKFIEHYRNLGFECFVFLDNGSNDKTLEILEKEKGITIIQTHLKYKTYQNYFKRYPDSLKCKTFK